MKSPINSFLYVALCMFIALIACSSKQSRLSIRVKEVNFPVKSDCVIEGKQVYLGELGTNDFLISDSLLLFTSNDPGGMLKVFSLNSMKQIGNFCLKGRAKNEFFNTDLIACTITKGDDLILPLMNYPNDELKLVNVTKSLEESSTVIEEVTDFHFPNNYVLLNNNSQDRFEYNYDVDSETRQKGLPVQYVIRNGDKRKKLSVFSKPVKYEDKEAGYIEPYASGLFKHPNKNIVLQIFINLDYLFFFDIDNHNYFAMHKSGSSTFDDVYKNSDYLTFGDEAVSDDFFFILYWKESYLKGLEKKPLVLVFDWNGSFVNCAQLDEVINAIEYDSKHKLLYGLNRTDETVFTFDVSQMLE